MARPITVAIIEDHPVVIEGVRSWVEHDADRRVQIVASGDSVEAVLRGPGAEADVFLLDLNLHGHIPIDAIEQLSAAGRRVVVFSQLSDPDTVLSVIDAGASEFLAKDEGGDHCVETIVAVAEDRPYVTPSVAGAIMADRSPTRPKLSEKEHTALLLWFQSMSKASVAQRMGIKESTVRQYIDRARIKYTKTGRTAATKTALLARAIEDGLIRADEVGEYRSRAASAGTPSPAS